MRIPHQVRSIAKDAYRFFRIRGVASGMVWGHEYLIDVDKNVVLVKRGSLTYEVTIGKTWH